MVLLGSWRGSSATTFIVALYSVALLVMYGFGGAEPDPMGITQ